jgi:hypothetical protein
VKTVDSARHLRRLVEIAEDRRDRSRNTAPASVGVTRLVVRRSSLTPSRPSRLATIRDTEGCETPNSRATREKLPVSAARTNTDNSWSLSLIR